MEALLSSSNCVVQGFLAAGHVCTIMGYEEYFPIAEKYQVPIVVTGFEPLDILEGILMTVSQLEEGRHRSREPICARHSPGREPPRTGTHRRSLRSREPPVARPRRDSFQRLPVARALSEIRCQPTLSLVFGEPARESPECISGLILQGIKKPHECPAFAVKCTPENPLGAPMVSSEGACAAYYHYGRRQNHDRVQPELSGTPSR